MVLKSLMCVEDVIGHESSFEVYGFDVMFDTDHKAWLIEVATSAMLRRSDSSMLSGWPTGQLVAVPGRGQPSRRSNQR